MTSRADKIREIIACRVRLLIAQSNSDDFYDETIALRDAISMALQGENSSLGVMINERFVPRGKKLSDDANQAISVVERALIDQIPVGESLFGFDLAL
jgi:hypothetical protein